MADQNRIPRLQHAVSALNPFAEKELRGRMRSARTYTLLTVYLAVVSGLSLILYLFAAASNPRGTGNGPAGTSVFALLAGMQIVLVCFVAPALTAGAITSEKERMTYDLLRVTPTTSSQIVWTKLWSALGFVLLIILATLPLYSLALILGGVELIQVAMALVTVVCAAFLFSAIGLYISSRVKTTLSAMVLTYTAIVGIVLGVPIVTLIGGPVITSLLQPNVGSAPATDITPLIILAGITIVGLLASSPISALSISQAAVADGHTNWWAIPAPYAAAPAGTGLEFPSPFIINVALYLVMGFIFVWATIRCVRRPDHE